MRRYKYTALVFTIIAVAVLIIAARQGAWS